MLPRDLAEEICRRLRAAGHQAYLVGGCVRDLLLGREPADYDVATDAFPERVQEMFPGSIGVGAKFGVVLVSHSAPRCRSGQWPASKSRRIAPMWAIPTGGIRTALSIRARRRRMCAGAISPSTA